MIYPTIKAMPSGTQRDSAYAEMTANSQRQAMANKLMSGGLKRRSSKRRSSKRRSSKRRSSNKRRRSSKRRGGGGGLAVPQFTMSYTPQGGPGTNPNNQIQSNSQTSTQITANKAFDDYASIKG